VYKVIKSPFNTGQDSSGLRYSQLVTLIKTSLYYYTTVLSTTTSVLEDTEGKTKNWG